MANGSNMSNPVQESLEYISEDKNIQKIISTFEADLQEKIKPPSWLEHVESPFKWLKSIQGALIKNITIDLRRKLKDYENHGPFYGFEKFSFLLILVIEKIVFDENIEDNSSPLEHHTQQIMEEEEHGLDETFSELEAALNEMATHEGDVMFLRIGPALRHVFHATQAHILFIKGQISASKEVAANIENPVEMSSENKAGFEGLKAKFINTVYKNYRVALEPALKAIELDPNFGYWPYLTGKIIRRLRRDFVEEMPVEELEYFQKAVQLERNPKFLIFLAQAYLEMAFQLSSKKDRELNTIVDKYMKQSVELYRECWEMKNDSATIARRIGNGMMKMSREHIDLVVAKEALLKSAELSTYSEVTHHCLGRFYYNYEKDDEKAIEYFEKDLPDDYSCGEIIRLNLIRDPSYDPSEMLLYWVKHATGTVKEYLALGDAGWYYLVYEKNLVKAVEYFWMILRKDPESFRVKEFWSFAFCVKRNINMLEILVNEIILLKNSDNLQIDKKDMAFLESFLEKVTERHPELRKLSGNAELLSKVTDSVEKYIISLRKWRYNDSGCRKKETKSIVEAPGSWRNEIRQIYEETKITENERGSTCLDYKECGVDKGSTNQESNITSRSGCTYQNNNIEPVSSWRNKPDLDNRGGNSRFGSSSLINQNQFTRMHSSYILRGTNDQFGRRNISDGNTNENRKQHNYNNNRYDLTITDWRKENRNLRIDRS